MKDRRSLPGWIAVVAALAAMAAFFLPYISATEDYREYMRDYADDRAIAGVDMTIGEMMDLSLFKYVRVYIQGGDTLFSTSDSGITYALLYSAVPFLALLVLLAALGRHPIRMLIYTLLMGGAVFLINWDFVNRGIMPDGDRLWAIAHGLYAPLASVMGICAIWMLDAERRMKKEMPSGGKEY